jgi:predicted RNA binding protein YcfA (HicA-like mRNA interferase family)
MVAALPRKDLIRKFRALGYSGPFSGGKHQFMIKGSRKIRIPNPHVGDISASLVKEILRQAGISSQEWDNV